ncbi:MAG TPA: glycosyltransferase family 39 protein [Tepidisphaeraceae bacterium]|jgi:4-amino-4-deoxy-L-arabinose transferase-like glycosyltransferase|nr:glycosyltransferase family 39 protein [Tepidisphaeraceae bacterium]
MTPPPTSPATAPIPPADLDPSTAPARPGRTLLGAPLLVFLLSLVMHVPFLGITPIAGTEGHRIFPAHEMVRSGWWMVPMLFGKPLLTKPPLHLWLIALSETIAGHGGVFVWRMPSALCGAMLCSAACWFGGRWFGKTAGLISGFCALGMLTLWGQSQVADIDATNTLFAALAAFCGIELFFASGRARAVWVLWAGLAIGATLMTKGPAGATIMLGVWVFAIVDAVRAGQIGRIARTAFWLPWLIGGAIFAAYAFAASASMKAHGISLADGLTGLREGQRHLYPESFKALLWAVFVVAELLAFGLPATIALGCWFNPAVRDAMEPNRRRIAGALAASALIGLAVCLMTGTDNPRYEYVMLPPLCPLAGAVAMAALAAGPREVKWLKIIAGGSAIALAGVAFALTIGAWPLIPARVLLVACAAWSVIVCAGTIARLNSSWRGAWGLAVLIVLTAIPFGFQRHYDRANTSGIHAAQTLRQIVGKNPVVAVGGAVTSKPEVFYYAGAKVRYFPKGIEPGDVSPGMWVYLEEGERKRWLKTPGVKLERVTAIPRTPKVNDYLAWYGAGPALPNVSPGPEEKNVNRQGAKTPR